MSFSGRFSDYPRLEIPVGDKMKRVAQIVRKHDGQILWQRKCINLVPISTTTDGKTIYNGVGYKDGVVKWVNTETELEALGIVTTGYFPAKTDDVISVRGINWKDGIGYNVVGAYKSTNDPTKHLGERKTPAAMNYWYDNVYVNEIPTSKDTDGTIYNGIGYKKGIRYTNGTKYQTDANCCVSGIIEVQNYDVIYLKDVVMNKNAGDGYCNFLYYTEKGGWGLSSLIGSSTNVIYKFDEEGNLLYFQIPNWGENGSTEAISKIRIQCSHIDLKSMVTINAQVKESIEYVNLIEQAINVDGTPYIGDNGEKGYRRNCRLDSSNAELTGNKYMFCTGYIPVEGYHMRYYFYNIWSKAKSTQENQSRCYFYDSNFQLLKPYFQFNSGNNKQDVYQKGQGIRYTSEGVFYSLTTAGIEYWEKGSNLSSAAYMRITSEMSEEEPIIVKINPIPREGRLYTNQIPISTNFDGTIYNNIGYKEETHYRTSTSDKAYEYANSTTGVTHPVFTTGRIPVSNGDIIRFKNCYFDRSASNASQASVYGTSGANMVIGFSDDSHYSFAVAWSSSTLDKYFKDIVKDEKNRVTQLTFEMNDAWVDHISFSLAPTHTPEDAIITINEEIYEPGDFNIHIKKNISSAKYARISGYGDGRNLAVVVNEDFARLPKTTTYTNQVPLSTESDGVTIYNNGLGYMNGSRISSSDSGAVIKASPYGATHTGFIPVKPGDVIRISGANFGADGTETAINTYDSTFTVNGQTTLHNGNYGIFYNSDGAGYKYRLDTTLIYEKTGVWKWVVPAANSQDKFTVSYIRITARGYHTGSDALRICPGERLILTINEEIND